MKIMSWNVNGMFSALGDSFVSKIRMLKPDVVCLQEVKTKCDFKLKGYEQYWNLAERPGYSGTAMLSQLTPRKVTYGFGCPEFDAEGRLICMELKDFYLINVYVPNTQNPLNPRPEYRREWDAKLREYVSELDKPAILCGDFNVAHRYIDVYPENLRNNEEETKAFTSEERDGMDQLLALGFVDAYRELYPTRKDCYTWWSTRQDNHRAENKGWRLDYFIVSESIMHSVRMVEHFTRIKGSDHCPIVLHFEMRPQDMLSPDKLADEWESINWRDVEGTVFEQQKKISKAAICKDWISVEILQKKLVQSMEARELAVRHVASAKSVAAGVDGKRWKTAAEKMEAVYRLTDEGYKAQPYRCIQLEINGKERALNIPTYFDRAVHTLYAYALDPVEEATGDKKSFGFRRGRSTADAHAYIVRMFEGKEAPKWVLRADIHAHYYNISHKWLMENIPMNKNVLYEVLAAGAVIGGKLFPTDEGISLASPLSAVLGNMVLDGLQKHITARMLGYARADDMPVFSTDWQGRYLADHDYANGDVLRYADDIIISARTKQDAERIKRYLVEFLAERGLTLSPEKTYIVPVEEGFSFLSRKYTVEDGGVFSQPTAAAVIDFEERLEDAIGTHQGSQESLIKKVNSMLTGWASYYKITFAHEAFRHIDAVVDALLLKKVQELNPRRQLGHLQRKYWYRTKDDENCFTLADDPSIRIKKLSRVLMVKHNPIWPSFNYYLDLKDYQEFSNERKIQKHIEEYQPIWDRQSGKCFYCGFPMWPEQEVTVVEKEFGAGRRSKNLVYAHKSCTSMELFYPYTGHDDGIEELRAPLNIERILDELNDPETNLSGPYANLREHFRLQNKPHLQLSFVRIERIMGIKLNERAYYDENFWTDVWPEDGEECIAQTWESQNYKLHTVNFEQKYAVFQLKNHNNSGLRIPKAITAKKLPLAAIREIEKFFEYIIKKYRLG